MKLTVMGGHGRDLITQAEIDHVIGLNNRIAELARARDAFLENILRRRVSGAPVEPGIHALDLVDEFEGGVRRQKIKLR